MLNAVMSQYARINNLKMPSMFREPIDIKNKELNIILSKINPFNIKEYNDIRYRSVLEDKMYLYPETGINFVIRVPKSLDVIKKIKKDPKFEGAWGELEFWPNIDYPEKDPTELGRLRRSVGNGYSRESLKGMLLLFDEIREYQKGKKFIFLDRKYGEKFINNFLNEGDKNSPFAVFCGLGFNVIINERRFIF